MQRHAKTQNTVALALGSKERGVKRQILSEYRSHKEERYKVWKASRQNVFTHNLVENWTNKIAN